MAFQFFLRFTGLCAFASNNGRMYSILINARDHPHGFAVHTAALVVPQVNVHLNSKREPTKTFEGSKTRFQQGDLNLYELEGEELSLYPFFGTLKLQGPRKLKACPSKSDYKSFYWLPRVSDLKGRVPKKELFENQSGLAQLILARLHLRAGTLRTSAFAVETTEGGGKRLVRWQYQDPEGSATYGGSRALAEESELELPVNEDCITIRSKALPGGSAGDDLVLKPDGGQVEAWLVNSPRPDIFAESKEALYKADLHFKHFYRLATKSGGLVPVPLGYCSNVPKEVREIRTVSNPKCPPLVFDST